MSLEGNYAVGKITASIKYRQTCFDGGAIGDHI